MRWSEFVERRERRRVVALSAVPEDGPLRGADLIECLDTWRFVTHSAVLDGLATQLNTKPPSPAPRHRCAVLAPREDLPTPADPEESRTEAQWRRWLEQHVHVRDAPRWKAASWALAELSWIGEETERTWRVATSALPSPDDESARRAWTAWPRLSTGDVRAWTFVMEGGWEALCWRDAKRSLYAGMGSYRMPYAYRAQILDDVQEAFPYLFMGDGDGSPGWKELAIRVLEDAGGEGQIAALAHALPEGAWELVRDCALRRAPWLRSSKRLGPRYDELAQATQGRDRLEALLDLHVASRLIERWRVEAACGVDTSWQATAHHRRRACGRLRALVRDAPGDALVNAVVELPGLAERTRKAVARYMWGWFFVYPQGELNAVPREVTQRCVMPPPPATLVRRAEGLEVEAEERDLVLYLYLRGLRPALMSYLICAGKPPTRLSEALADLSDTIADPGQLKPRRYQALRASLRSTLPRYVRELTSTLREVAALEGSRSAKRAALARILDPVWRSSQERPLHCIDKMIANARQILEDLEQGASC